MAIFIKPRECNCVRTAGTAFNNQADEFVVNVTPDGEGWETNEPKLTHRISVQFWFGNKIS